MTISVVNVQFLSFELLPVLKIAGFLYFMGKNLDESLNIDLKY